MYRYFYNTQGELVSRVQYNNSCSVLSVCNISDYIDLEQKVQLSDYRVDLATKTLVSNSPN